MNYQFVIGESVLLDILGSIVETTVIAKSVFLGKPVYKVQFQSGNTAVKLETNITANTLKWTTTETPATESQ